MFYVILIEADNLSSIKKKLGNIGEVKTLQVSDSKLDKKPIKKQEKKITSCFSRRSYLMNRYL